MQTSKEQNWERGHGATQIWAFGYEFGSREVDLEFRIGHGNWPGFHSDMLFQDPLVAVCSTKTGALINAPALPDKLAKCGLVHVLGAEDYWATFFDRVAMKRDRKPSDMSVDSAIAAAEITLSSGKVALIHQRFAQHYIDANRLMLASKDMITPKEAIYLLSPKSSKQRKPEAALFERWIKDVIEEA